jgi:hypothetical protein
LKVRPDIVLDKSGKPLLFLRYRHMMIDTSPTPRLSDNWCFEKRTFGRRRSMCTVCIAPQVRWSLLTLGIVGIRGVVRDIGNHFTFVLVSASLIYLDTYRSRGEVVEVKSFIHASGTYFWRPQ